VTPPGNTVVTRDILQGVSGLRGGRGDGCSNHPQCSRDSGPEREERPIPPPTTYQSGRSSPFFAPLRQHKKKSVLQNEEKDGKKVEKEELKCSRLVVGWGGYTNFPEDCADVGGSPSNLVSKGGTRLGCSSTSSFTGCSSCVCSPSRDTSLVAGSSDMFRTPASLTASSSASPSSSSPAPTSLSSRCRCVPSVCLCRDYEKTQG
jgi:hypothetical protein